MSDIFCSRVLLLFIEQRVCPVLASVWASFASRFVRRFACVLVCLLPMFAHADVVGLVLDIQGDRTVQIARGDQAPQSLEVLTYLEPGHRLVLPDKSRVSMSLYQNRRLVHLNGPGHYTVEADRVDTVNGTEPTSREFATALAVVQPGVRLSKGGSRMRSLPPMLAAMEPPPDAPFEERMLYLALLIDINARGEAMRLWTQLQQQRPELQGKPLPP